MSLDTYFYQQEAGRLRGIVGRERWYEDIANEARGLRLARIALAGVAMGRPGGAMGRLAAGADLRLQVMADLLDEGAVCLGSTGPDWDAERTPAVEQVIIHHTSRPPGLDLRLLNAMHLLQIYVPAYARPAPGDVPKLATHPQMYSGHFDERGKQVFYGYHWLVRQDGETEPLLPDAAIGWQAGNWAVNCSSVAVCFDADLERPGSAPSADAITAAAALIRDNYPGVAADPNGALLGHGAVTKLPGGTICPGPGFNVPGGWGDQLRQQIAS